MPDGRATPYRAATIDLGDVRLHAGDCLEVLADLEAESVACVVTSPPYNTLGSRVPSEASGLHRGNRWVDKIADHGYADDMDESTYQEWLSNVSAAILRVCRPGASFFFNHKIRYRDGIPIHPYDFVKTWPGWRLRQEIVWDRRRSMVLNARMFAPCDERIYWMVKPGADYTWNQETLSMSVWVHPPDQNPDGEHPCPFPLPIPNRCILATTAPGDVVLDPFVGSGTTMLSARDLGRHGVGIDIDRAYLEIAARRLDQLSLLGGAA